MSDFDKISDRLSLPDPRAHSSSTDSFVDIPVHAQIRWVRGKSRMSLGQGRMVVELGRTIRPIGNSNIVQQAGGVIHVVVLPCVPQPGQLHILVRGDNGSVFVSPLTIERHRVIAELRNQGFNVQLHVVPGLLSLILGFYFKPILWTWAQSRGWLKR